MKIKLVILSLLFLLPAVQPAQSSDNSKDLEAINQTILNYIDGWYEGNAERMEAALHPELTKKGIREFQQTGGQLITYSSASNLVEYTKAGLGKLPEDQREIKVEILDIYNNIATAKATSAKFIDYIHLVKNNGEWKIINVLWVPTPQ